MKYLSSLLVLVLLLSTKTEAKAQVYGHYRLCDANGLALGYLDDGIISDEYKQPLYEIKKVTGGILRGRSAGGDPLFAAGSTGSPETYEVFNASDQSVGKATLTLGVWRVYDGYQRLVYQTCGP